MRLTKQLEVKRSVVVRFAFLVLGMVGLFFPSLAMAVSDSAVLGSSTVGPSMFNYSPADMSVTYLSQIFGTVGGVLGGTGSSLIGIMAQYLNNVLLMIVIIMAGYTTLLAVINTAGEGEFLGKKLSSVWVPVRIVISIMLLSPTTSGYCMMQVIVMYFILQGVGAADYLTNKIVTYFQAGQTLYSTAGYNSSDFSSTVQTLFTGLVCQQSAYLEYPDTNTTIPTAPTADTTNIDQSSKPYFRYKFNEMSDDTGATINCGTVKVKLDNYGISNSDNTSVGSTGVTKEQLVAAAQIKAVDAMMETLNSVAYYYVNQDVDDEEDDNYDSRNKATIQLVGPNFLTTMENQYGSASQQASNLVYNTSSKYDDYYAYMRAYGWLTLGSTYYIFTSISSDADQLADGFNIEDFTNNDPTTGNKDYNKDASAASSFISSWSDYMDTVNSAIDSIDVTQGANTSPHGFGFTVIPSFNVGALHFKKLKLSTRIGNIIKNAINNSMNDFISALNYSNDNLDVNPLITAAKVGNKMMVIAGKAWTAYIMAMVVSAIGMGICASLDSFFLVFVAVMTLVSPILFFIIGFLITVGGALGVWLPMVPFVIFSISAVIWFVFCIEAMFAAPFSAAGLAWPDGHEVWGKAEPAVLLTVSVFLRPSLIVIGFIAALILSYAACSVVNFGFGTIIALITSNAAAGVIEMYMIMLLYVGLYIAIVNEAFAVVAHVPDRVFRWLQGGEGAGAHSNALEATDKAKGKFESDGIQGAKSGGEAFGNSAKEGNKGAQEHAYKRRGDADKDAQGQAGGNDTGGSDAGGAAAGGGGAAGAAAAGG